MNEETNTELENLISECILSFSENQKQKDMLVAGVSSILGKPFKLKHEKAPHVSIDTFIDLLTNFNEKESRQKHNGVFYTPKDVTSFITYNAFINYVFPENTCVFNTSSAKDHLFDLPERINRKVLKTTVFDPTCGNGEFLISAFLLKYSILKKSKNKVLDADIYNIVASIHANDIEESAIRISKIRLFFLAVSLIKNVAYSKKIAQVLNDHFLNNDFVIFDYTKFSHYDIILGNPPYVEYRQLLKRPNNDFGNCYADVLVNCSELLNSNGVMSFIIPLSYVSTPRMQKLREKLSEVLGKQFVLNYADRPDCLFTSVHQKLTILIGRKQTRNKAVFSSSYFYWYKSERNKLFDEISVSQITWNDLNYLPKLGSEIENNIFTKTLTRDKSQSLLAASLTEGSSVFLNMRGCFWMKAFTFNPGSNEYREYCFDSKYTSYIHCLLNSSLFFFFWIATSDCWHITQKELGSFLLKPIEHDQVTVFDTLSKELENMLEKTKVYVGTKQVEYEYKHKDCKSVIDKIDRELQHIYNLTDDELSFIINFNIKYRMSDGQ